MGRSDAYASSHDLESEKYMPLPKGNVHKCKELIQDVMLGAVPPWASLLVPTFSLGLLRGSLGAVRSPGCAQVQHTSRVTFCCIAMWHVQQHPIFGKAALFKLRN